MSAEVITVMIADADADASHKLDLQLRSIPGVEVAGIASEATLVFQLIAETVPDVIFIEVEMPGKNGFEICNELRQLNIASYIIFLSVSNHFAIRAIRCSAIDYLIKPVDTDDLTNALIRCRKFIREFQRNEKLDTILRHTNSHERIKLTTGHGFILIDPSDIIYCKADWSYTEIYLFSKQMIVVSMNIGKVEGLLNPERFRRISRSIIINLSSLVSINRKSHKCLLSFGGTQIEHNITGKHLSELESLSTF
jgi:two-component system LytT family response regulator